MADILDFIGFCAELETDVSAAGNQVRYAEQIGMSHTTVSQILNGRRLPSAAFLDAAGFDCFPRYRAVGGGKDASLINNFQFFTKVETRIRTVGSLRGFCRVNGLNASSVSKFLNDEAKATDDLLRVMGYVRLTCYRRRPTKPAGEAVAA
ncbi:helix-turn-helix transcriptional regulator [Gluconobacter sp. LMG 1744]|uniref:helix-turn-helix domain-containing protein n=1 Tax=Gluconobacter cadivus TaxID=2728101 RepID=UPI001884C67D|nr:helix-turn-helix transcriptional regulator [Gluconobacter cadivus]MBF0892184.1 helix-turn-helix transcriptional regulator [Gluconobacter cadivus]